jgi:hypothetical protein
LFFATLIGSCSLHPDLELEAEAVNPLDSELTQRDYLALLKTQDSHKVSVDELQNIVSGVLSDTQTERLAASAINVITSVRQVPVNIDRRFSASTNRGARSTALAELESDPVEIYEFSVGQPGTDMEFLIPLTVLFLNQTAV